MAEVRFVPNPGAEQQLASSRSSPFVRHMVRVEQAVKGAADRLTPVDTGQLRRSNDARMMTRGTTITVRVFNPTNYAVFVHSGTRYMRGRPWISEAVRLVTGKSPR